MTIAIRARAATLTKALAAVGRQGERERSLERRRITGSDVDHVVPSRSAGLPMPDVDGRKPSARRLGEAARGVTHHRSDREQKPPVAIAAQALDVGRARPPGHERAPSLGDLEKSRIGRGRRDHETTVVTLERVSQRREFGGLGVGIERRRMERHEKRAPIGAPPEIALELVKRRPRSMSKHVERRIAHNANPPRLFAHLSNSCGRQLARREMYVCELRHRVANLIVERSLGHVAAAKMNDRHPLEHTGGGERQEFVSIAVNDDRVRLQFSQRRIEHRQRSARRRTERIDQVTAQPIERPSDGKTVPLDLVDGAAMTLRTVRTADDEREANPRLGDDLPQQPRHGAVVGAARRDEEDVRLLAFRRHVRLPDRGEHTLSHVFIIAEAGVNHDGSLERALELVDVAARAGADAVKFQTFRSERVVSKHARKAAYQEQRTGSDESQLDMVRKLELRDHDFERLKRHADERGIRFLSTPFDEPSVDALVRIGVDRLKLASGEVTNPLLLRKAAATGLPVILSTGMSTLGEVEQALGFLAAAWLGSPRDVASALASEEGRRLLRERATLLHCTTEYPAPFEDVNLRAMVTLAQAFALPVGLSDHTPGIAVSIAAVALGASVIEKHITLDKTLPGPDHTASLEPTELAALVDGIRAVEAALGSPIKAPAASEQKNIAVARRSLVAARAIRAGELLTAENMTAKRPGTGLSAVCFDELEGTAAVRDFEEDEPIEWRDRRAKASS